MKKHIFWIGLVLELKCRQIWLANVLGRLVGEAGKKIGREVHKLAAGSLNVADYFEYFSTG